MILKELTKDQYDQAAKSFKNLPLLQASPFLERAKERAWMPHYLGFFKQDTCVGLAGLSSQQRLLGMSDFQCQQGPIFHHWESINLEEVTELLRKYLIEHQGLQLTISPDVVLQSQLTGQNFKQNDLGHKIHKDLVQAGFSHDPKSDQNPLLLRWFYKKDLSPYKNHQDLKQSFDKLKKRLIKQGDKLPLTLSSAAYDQMADLKAILDDSANRQQFDGRELSYYQTLYQAFAQSPYDYQCFLLSCDMDAYQSSLKKDLKVLNEELLDLADPTSDKQENLAQQKRQQIQSLQKKLDKYHSIQGSVILSAGIFIGLEDDFVYFSGGSNGDFLDLNGSTYLQWKAMTYAYDKGYKTYNFYGTRGNHSGHPDEEGVTQFKEGFMGQLIQTIGFYTLRNTCFKSQLIYLLRHLKHMIKG